MKYIKMTEVIKQHVDEELKELYEKPISKEDYCEYVQYKAEVYGVSTDEIEEHIQDIVQTYHFDKDE